MTQSNEPTIAAMNESIALFDGWEPNYGGDGSPYYSKKTEFIPKFAMIVDMQYHTSWDWLMPVWKKAGEEIFNIRGDLSNDKYLEAHRITKAFMEGCQKVDINQAYNQVYNAVQFIQWYQQQKQSNGEDFRMA